MAIFIFANNAGASLAGPISNVALSLTLASGTGALFPNPGAGQQFAMTLNDALTGVNEEIVYCTARAGDVCTILRAQEGSIAQNWIAGDLVSQFVTAGQMTAMLQAASLYPARIVTASGVFAITTDDAFGGVGLNRTAAPAVSSTTLPAAPGVGQTYAIEDLAGNFAQFPVTVAASAGKTIAGLASVSLNVNRQCAYFRYYGSNIWSVKF